MVRLPIQVWFSKPRTTASATTWLNNNTVYNTGNHVELGFSQEFKIYVINDRQERTFTMVQWDVIQHPTDNRQINVLVGTLRKEPSG